MKKNIECNSGCALGSDTYFENKSSEYGIKCNAFSYKTYYHKSPNKVEISESDFIDGIDKVLNANKLILKRPIDKNTKFINLLARNWAQVKYSKYIIAIGRLVEPKQMGSKYISKSPYTTVDGGTGYAVAMAIVEGDKEIYVFDLTTNTWNYWVSDVNRFVLCDIPDCIDDNFAGIGTRELNRKGEEAIDDFFKTNFSKIN